MRRNRYIRQNGRSGVWMLAGILILASAVGYLGTRYFIAPYVLKCEIPDPAASVSLDGVVSGEQDIKNVSDSAVKNREDSAGSDSDKQENQSAPESLDVNPDPGTGQDSQGNVGSGEGSQTGPAADQQIRSTAAAAPTGKYAVQFASFSAEEAAKTEVSVLASKNITASVLSRDGAFKVIGAPFDTKEQAKTEAERLRPMFPDVFVTGI